MRDFVKSGEYFVKLREKFREITLVEIYVKSHQLKNTWNHLINQIIREITFMYIKREANEVISREIIGKISWNQGK